MELKKANDLKEILNRKKTFDVRKVKGLLPKKDWNLIVYEINQKGEKKLVLLHIEFMQSFKVIAECGLFIEASENIPHYTLF